MSEFKNQFFIDQLLNFFDARFSMSNSLFFHNQLQEPIKLYHVSIFEQNDRYSGASINCAGACKSNKTDALTAAVCEFIERNSLKESHDVALDNILQLNAEFKEKCISTEEIIKIQGFSPIQFNLKQFRFKKITPETSFNWVKAHRFFTDEEIYIPNEMVSLVRNPYFEVTTNGCSLAQTKDEAIEKAIHELLERNLVMSFWWKKIQPIYLNLSEILDQKLQHLKYAFGPWLKYIHLATVEHEFGVPIFFAFFNSENGKGHPAFVMSAACHCDPYVCAEKALTELGGMLNTNLLNIKNIIKNNKLKTGNFDNDITSFTDHHSLYVPDRAKKFLHFEIPEKNQITYKDNSIFNDPVDKNLSSRLTELKTILKKKGYNPIYINQSAKYVSDLNLYVYRVLDANIIDLNSHHCTRRWGKSQLFDDQSKNIFDLNQYPHPFP